MLQCAALLVVTLTWAAGDEATDLEKAGNAINDICHKAKFYSAAAEEINDATKKRLTNLKIFGQHPHSWRLAVAVTKQVGDRAKFLVLAAYSIEILQAAAQATIRQAEAASDAQAAAHRWSATPVATATGSKTTLNAAASAATGTTSSKAKMTILYSSTATVHCDNHEVTDGAEGEATPDIMQAKSLRISDSANVRHQAQSAVLNLEAKDSGANTKDIFDTTIGNGKFIMTSCSNNDYFTMTFSKAKLKTYEKPVSTPLGQSSVNHRICSEKTENKTP
uniref:Variant surface glycoprotein 1831 n=1 Tax=Trypanosoma brucei TaxID=5691 RepID=M4TCL9_9TRYP|nr:variant surface glycoprotein 1831 [Trypanosoma brucei]